jgi:hypothetical protein
MWENELKYFAIIESLKNNDLYMKHFSTINYCFTTIVPDLTSVVIKKLKLI